ncbi:MAG: transcriptional activator NhaR [Pseudomonadota bacterium]|nr:transcriptional activator NhaR [Pseudomonadota bacterium]
MNFKHLYYFWATAHAGGVMRAGAQLHTTPQTLSGQIKLLEARLGCHLFTKRGRRLELTEAGRAALKYADQIFALGEELEAAMGKAPGLDFRVGLADSVPKAIAYRLLEPALGVAGPVRLICHEGRLDDLLGQLSVHKVDLVIADEPMSRQLSVKAFNHALGTTAMSFFCTAALKKTLGARFPNNLQGAPMLIPGAHSAIRRRFDFWLATHEVRPRIVGEFDDTALVTAFGREGRGVFMAPTVLEQETCRQYGVRVLGRSDDLVEEFYAISVERRITHPCVEAITQAARGRLFPA